MKYFNISFILFMALSLTNCSKSSSNGIVSPAPTNLILSVSVSTDNSGEVSFTANATNAVSYDYDFGNGNFQTVTTGITTYKYLSSGTYTVTVIAKSSGGLTIAKSLEVMVGGRAGGMTLFWADEFNSDGAPDPTKWGYDTGTGSGGWGNSELEYYTSRAQNVIVQGGILKITALKESYGGSAYTSARMLSKNKFSFTYGRIEIRAMLPAGLGTWPALWMLGSNVNSVSWPACGEIDIMEQRGSELNKIFGTLHYPDHSGANGNSANVTISDATTKFHVYAMDWSAASIKLYVDGVLFQTVANSAGTPFNNDFFFILNVAMGGNFAGAVDPAFTSAAMQVDYIRVYR